MSKTIARTSGRQRIGARRSGQIAQLSPPVTRGELEEHDDDVSGVQNPADQQQGSPVVANLSLERRLQLALGAAWELEALAVRIRAEENADFEQDVALNVFADRLDVIASALMEVANPEEDQHHDAAELQRILRFAPTPD